VFRDLERQGWIGTAVRNENAQPCATPQSSHDPTRRRVSPAPFHQIEWVAASGRLSRLFLPTRHSSQSLGVC
jgi:hypothetical protein